MKQFHKLTALLLVGAMFGTAMPVSAEDGEVDPIMASVSLADTGITIEALMSAEGISADGSKVTITKSGAYLFSGTLSDGQIIVNIPDEVADPGTVKLYFDGVNITGVSEAPVYIINAENTSINLMNGTENVLSDGGLYTDTTAVIYAKDDLTIKGGTDENAGKLTVNSVYQHGIHCNNDFKFNGGNVKVRTNDGDGTTTGTGDGIRGKTSVTIKDGKLDVNAGGDGVKSTKGTVTISGGDTEIKAGNDAVQGEIGLDISGGRLKANGDRGLRLDNGTINITGGEILATATDYQVNNPDNNTTISAAQVTVLISLREEQVKDQEILITDRNDASQICSFNPDKKFKYLLVSNSTWTKDGEYKLTIGGKELIGDSETTITGSEDGMIYEFINSLLKEAEISYDVDCDGVDELEDAVLLARIIAEDTSLKPTVTPAQIEAADINKDGNLDGLDLSLLLRHLAE